jgi:hypothetical protein
LCRELRCIHWAVALCEKPNIHRKRVYRRLEDIE